MELYKDQSRSFEERAADLVSRMTLEEKIFQAGNKTASIPRLGVPAYDYWSEASHGFFGPMEVVPMDVTSYPVCLAMSQSWDREKIKEVAAGISDECRAHHNLNGIELHYWCPTINLARDPRNGRSDENFGEDPFLAGKMAASYIQGMQGSDEHYLKSVSTPKHYAMNSSENNRHTGSSNADEATLREYYGKVFEYAIREGGAQSIMTSYNRVNGVPSSVNDFLLTTLLREEWGFDGFVVSDCGAVADSYYNPMFSKQTPLAHSYCKSMEEASAMTLIAGTDISCGLEHKRALAKALELGYITEDTVDRALVRALTTRFKLGLFDDPEKVPYTALGSESVASPALAKLSVDMAKETIVLLKNDKGLLPLDKANLKKILVVGPNAIYRQLGGYSAGQSPLVDTVESVLALAGIQSEAEGIEVAYEKGWCTAKEYGRSAIEDMLPGLDPEDMILDVFPDGMDIGEAMKLMMGGTKKFAPEDPDFQGDNEVIFSRALAAAKEADAVIVIAGTDDTTASEEHDRDTLALPYGQDEKILQLLEANPSTIVVLTTLGAVTGKFFDEAHTLVNAHFAGQAQGTAIADILFGKANPSAKLTATWYKSLDDIPEVNDYAIKRQDSVTKKPRTYMYFDDPVLFPFGYGLSYSKFEYLNLSLDKPEYDANDTIKATFEVKNPSETDGAEIAQVYVSKIIPAKTRDNKPIRQLKGFAKKVVKAGETQVYEIEIPVKDISFWSNRLKKTVVEPGEYKVEVGGSSSSLPLSTQIAISGVWDAKLSTVYAVADKYVYHVGDEGEISVTATLEDTSRICLKCNKPVFASSDESVAVVDEEGNVTAKGPGTALITVTVEYNGLSKTAKIPVAAIE
ncbi:MAG: glycoside hydrolase family 3 C-terminal domain-containing protein [Clostridiales bacterium]|jgi:beta-glucosidase|nr:glycoside hydrolase family 3 C-terminal domain-containing protein [Clostridiales bacterium]